LVSSNPTVAETAPFVQRNPSGDSRQASVRPVNKYQYFYP
jgi:hypothetical protein